MTEDFLIHVDKGNLEAATVARIVGAWKRAFGMALNRERVANHLRSLREWREIHKVKLAFGGRVSQ